MTERITITLDHPWPDSWPPWPAALPKMVRMVDAGGHVSWWQPRVLGLATGELVALHVAHRERAV